ncbi:uncharacterized protein LOC129596406 [Paramacrobiotus metropolitanus]|uniref:uncharacterized protein LOC129596406 n=1 Tax=Paramacrobiotus metropolitanus TaxID=2943436 RepID=UPI0024462B2A|nr:uncharacterized protein LOC129596406 [Paramacrobiotus metropolitanus]
MSASKSQKPEKRFHFGMLVVQDQSECHGLHMNEHLTALMREKGMKGERKTVTDATAQRKTLFVLFGHRVKEQVKAFEEELVKFLVGTPGEGHHSFDTEIVHGKSTEEYIDYDANKKKALPRYNEERLEKIMNIFEKMEKAAEEKAKKTGNEGKKPRTIEMSTIWVGEIETDQSAGGVLDHSSKEGRSKPPKNTHPTAYFGQEKY